MSLFDWMADRIADFRWRHSPYWRGYRDGISARKRAHREFLRLQDICGGGE